MDARKWRWEAPEYLVKTEYPFPAYQRRIRGAAFGPYTAPSGDPAMQRMWRAGRRVLEHVIITPNEIILVKSRMKPSDKDIAALGECKALIPLTPELQEYIGRPVKKVLLCAFAPQQVLSAAAAQGIEVRILPAELHT